MSLVPYASSDVSDSEEENDSSNEDSNTPIIINRTQNSSEESNIETVLNNHVQESANENTRELFKALPTSKKADASLISEESDEFLDKKEVPIQKPIIKISVPSLPDHDDKPEEESKIRKFKAPSTKGTGLFSVLPPPRSSAITSQKLIPRTITQRPKKTIPAKMLKPIPAANVISKTSEMIEDDVVEGNDFFSLTSDVDDQPVNTYEQLDVPDSNKTIAILNQVPEVTVPVPPATDDFISLTTENNEVIGDGGLDEEALRALCGARGVKRRQETQILDLHEAQMRPTASEWMRQALKNNEEEMPAPTNALPGGMQRRKHQITYLAQQAKANEQQLKNMWAQNRFTRQQTQSKYGF